MPMISTEVASLVVHNNADTGMESFRSRNSYSRLADYLFCFRSTNKDKWLEVIDKEFSAL
jgi:hypothetical protein